MSTDALAGLREYHLPGSLHWWPPAPGWWGLALAAGALAIGALWLHRRRRRRRNQAPELALRELAMLREHWIRDGDDMTFLRGVAVLLRRYALARWPADDAAGLTGQAWRDYLARRCAAAPASVQAALAGALGEAVTESAYRAAADLEPEALAQAAGELIRHSAAPAADACP
jgi:hypothetical protein